MSVSDSLPRANSERKRRIGVAVTTGIQEFKLSVRALRVLKRLNVDCVADLAKVTPDMLSAQPNCGRKTIAEISELLQPFGAVLAGSASHAESSAREAARKIVTPCAVEEFDQLPIDRKVSLLRRVGEVCFSTRALHAFETSRIIYLGDLVQLTSAQLLRSGNFGRKSLEEVENALNSMGLSLGRTLIGWDQDLAARLEKTYDGELNELRRRELDRRFLANWRNEFKQTEVDVAADPTAGHLHRAIRATQGWRVKPKFGKALRLETALLEFLLALANGTLRSFIGSTAGTA
jgi:DNA-directed RNA polymerase alpha subunit